MPHMYILECVDGSYYTGSTTHLELRMEQHQSGCGAKHTAKRLPVKLVYCESFERVADAFYREKQVQGWSRKKKQALMASDTNLLHRLAVCQNDSHYVLASAPLSQRISLGAGDESTGESVSESSSLSGFP
jgi:putative endonuclease